MCGLAHRILGACVVVLLATPVVARSPGDPVRLTWMEGDIAGMSTIYDPTGDTPIGSVEYHQRRRGDTLSTVSKRYSQEIQTPENGYGLDWLTRQRANRLIGITNGVDCEVWDPQTDAEIPAHYSTNFQTAAGTFTLVFLVLKNFDANAEDGRVVFRTVAPIPRPMVINMELRRVQKAAVDRLGTHFDTVQYELRPTIHWSVDPIVHMVAPTARFWLVGGEPPALARFSGPRNFGRQGIVLQ